MDRIPLPKRIESLKLLNPTEVQLQELETFLRMAAAKPILSALADLADKPEIWVNALRLEGAVHLIQSIDLISWRNPNGRLYRWPGLEQDVDGESPPVFVLKAMLRRAGNTLPSKCGGKLDLAICKRVLSNIELLL